MANAHGTQRDEAGRDLLDPALRLRWRVPELALLLSDRVIAEARRLGDRSMRLHAEALALFALNRLGRGVAATDRAITAFREAESCAAEAIDALRVELAACARVSGNPELALHLLRPVLDQERIEPADRAHALIELASALPVQRAEHERFEALDEADRLYLASASRHNRDLTCVLRARINVVRARFHRCRAEFAEAATAAEAGLTLLDELADPAADSGETRAHLALERVHALLDLGLRDEAIGTAQPVIGQPVRAASADPAGWLRLALATRLHLPEGEHDVALRLLNDAAHEAERHELGGLCAETLTTLSHVHELRRDFATGLRCLRSACAADRRWRSTVQRARLRLSEEFAGVVPVRPGASPTGGTGDSSRVSRRRRAESVTLPEQERRLPVPDAREQRAAGAEPGVTGPGPTERSAYEPPAHDFAAPGHRVPDPVVAEPVAPDPVVPEPVLADPVFPEPDVLASRHGDGAAEPPSRTEAVTSQAIESLRSGEDVREAARRLMATLTSRSERADRRGTETEALAESPGSRATAEPTESAPLADEVRHGGGSSGRRAARRRAQEREAVEQADHVTSWAEADPAFAARQTEPVPPAEPVGLPPEPLALGEVPPWSRWEVPNSSGPAEPPVRGQHWPRDDRGAEPEPSRASEVPVPDDELGFPRYDAQARRHSALPDDAPAAEPPSRTNGAEPDFPEVTAIMPVVPAAPAELNGAHWPGANEEPTASDRDVPFAAAANSWPSSEANVSAHAEDEPSGRRARGKSLAEIRASLRVVQDSRLGGGTTRSVDVAALADADEQYTGSGRRARHADPEDHAGYADSVPQQEPVEAEPDSAENAGLADLLAEALVAYQNGRRVAPERHGGDSGGGRHGDDHVSGITYPVDDFPSSLRESTQDSPEPVVRARHRHAAEGAGTWTPQTH